MHRLMILKKLPVSKGNFSVTPSEVYYPRTCTLCNRVISTPLTGFPRIHSTLAHPERSTYIVRKKKLKAIKNATTPRVDTPSYSKLRRKMKITVLESTTAGDLPPSSFITSSPSSPVFSGLRVSGVTIMLPPNSSQDLVDSLSHLQKITVPEPLREGVQEPPDLSHVAALMLGGLSRNRHLLDDYFDQQGQSSLQETFTSKLLVEEMNTTQGDIVTQIDTNAEKELKNIPTESSKLSPEAYHKVNSFRVKRLDRRASYIDICINGGRVKHAFKQAMLGLSYFPGYPGRNVLLEPIICYIANEGDVASLVQLVNLAKRHHLSLTLLSYKNCLELMGRVPKTPFNVDVIKILLKSLEEAGLKLEDVILKCQNRPILIKKIFEAINCIDPEKAALYAVTSMSYNLDLLSPLNDTSQSKAKRFYSPASGLMVSENAEKLVDEQISLHNSQIFKVKNIACGMSNSEIATLVEKQNAVEDEWRVMIAAGIENGLKALRKDKTLSHLGNYLECLPLSTFVNIVIQEIHTRLDDSDKQSVGFIQAQRILGKRAKEFYDYQVLNRYGIGTLARDAHVEYCKRYSSPELYPEGPSNPREIWESVVSDMNYDDTHASQVLREWGLDIYSRIGKFLYDVLLKDVKINENIGTDKERHMVPALYVVFRKTTKGYQKQLKVHPAVHTIFPTRMQPFIAMNPFELPMVCPPRPWVSATDGVYPLAAPTLQRSPEGQNGEMALQENLQSANTQDLYPSLDSLNQLAAVPWKVNSTIYDIILEVFSNGGMKELAIPSPPTASKLEPSIPSQATLVDRSLISKERALIRQENAAEYSLWCDTLYKLCIANEFRDRVFWLPHNMDFRGRVYPICPHLQHMSNDMARSLLIFAKGEKLGPDGLDWLKIHTVNLVGNMNKDSIAARLAHANEALPKILDSAENPLTGEKWWMDSEYPWQTLAACIEIANAIASGDPENFVSHFPVHQDGSCNGLQHYAALGRDSLGAQSVNLVDTDKPSDVYSCVANLVEQQRAKDAADGNPLAQSLDGFIARKVVKQTVMTTVYGVTRYGAQMQIRGQLKDLEFHPDLVGKAALYITKLVFQSLGEMFTSSRNTQDWFTQCADQIVKAKSMPVMWVTPLGLPVLQPYFKKFASNKNLKQLSKEKWFNQHMYREPMSLKQRNAFSPNFIHSLDSCHMILTGLHCEQASITYVSVHDCYWVHAHNVKAMSKICREQFVNLHSKPILNELSDFMMKTYIEDESLFIDDKAIAAVEKRRLERLFKAVPPKGNFDLNEVLKSKYFFS